MEIEMECETKSESPQGSLPPHLMALREKIQNKTLSIYQNHQKSCQTISERLLEIDSQLPST